MHLKCYNRKVCGRDRDIGIHDIIQCLRKLLAVLDHALLRKCLNQSIHINLRHLLGLLPGFIEKALFHLISGHNLIDQSPKKIIGIR